MATQSSKRPLHFKNYNHQHNFNHLSVKDLVEARDMFHLHLMRLSNVQATAIGRYLIRMSDLDKYGRLKEYRPGQKPKRTLSNSMITDFSWPCVLVFIDQWQEEKELIQHGANNIVPKTIYMPDGRVVPICIVEVNKQLKTNSAIDINNLTFPTNYIGGGFPLTIHSQGVDRIATVGCVVSDGHKYYALTNKHVVGEEGEEIFSQFGDKKVKIGISSKTLGKVKFSSLYEGWENKNTLVSCDTGLVEITDINRWKTDVIGIPRLEAMYDLSTHNITLGMLAQHSLEKGKKQTLHGKVVGHGAVSGRMQGEIMALFYRYKSIGGTEYVSDFLISGQDGQDLNVNHGDSGTVWMLETKNAAGQNEYHPIGLHWGQHEFINNSEKGVFSYSMATCLSNVCREMDVEIVRGWNIDNDYSWGKVGHYTVGTAALECIQNPDLKKFLSNNLENISFQRSMINKKLDEKNKSKSDVINISSNPNNPDNPFCALADVPDVIWKQKNTSATPWGRYGAENPNHFADCDAPTKDGKTLFDLCNSKEKLTTQVWKDYYENIDLDAIGVKSQKSDSFGLISFRVWQIFNYMVDAIKKKRADKFLFASGVMIHYVGDACQPLHSTYLHDGDPKDTTLINYTAQKDSPPHSKNPHKKGDVYQKEFNPGAGVHVAYEDHMIDDKIGDIILKLFNMLKNNDEPINKEKIDTIQTGQDAGYQILELMKMTQANLRPRDIVTVYKQAVQDSTSISDTLYNHFGSQTIQCLARGSRYLAAVWDAAWRIGKGSTQIKTLDKIGQKKLIALYIKPKELPSLHLDTIGAILK